MTFSIKKIQQLQFSKFKEIYIFQCLLYLAQLSNNLLTQPHTIISMRKVASF
jgi:hypothetical protein